MRICVACKKDSIGLLSILKAALWGDLVCSSCSARLKINPTGSGIIAIVQFVLFFLFLFMAYGNQSWLYVVVLVFLWFFINVLGIFVMPLVEKNNEQ